MSLSPRSQKPFYRSCNGAKETVLKVASSPLQISREGTLTLEANPPPMMPLLCLQLFLLDAPIVLDLSEKLLAVPEYGTASRNRRSKKT